MYKICSVLFLLAVPCCFECPPLLRVHKMCYWRALATACFPIATNRRSWIDASDICRTTSRTACTVTCAARSSRRTSSCSRSCSAAIWWCKCRGATPCELMMCANFFKRQRNQFCGVSRICVSSFAECCDLNKKILLWIFLWSDLGLYNVFAWY